MGGSGNAPNIESGVQIYRCPSYGKINLRLAVLKKRKDGYHEVNTLLSRISLRDEVEIELKEEGITVSCSGAGGPEGAENLAYQAARIFLAQAGKEAGVEVRIHKRIPVSAGLGGGSSNAAAALVGLNELFHRPFTDRGLMKMGAELGADVPFFIFKGPALAFGKGDRLKRARELPHFWLLMVVPPFQVSTAGVYAQWSAESTRRRYEGVTNFHGRLEVVLSGLRNDLEKVVLDWHPELEEIKERLLSLGALGSLMSGSGGTVYGIFPDETRAAEAGTRLPLEAGWCSFLVHNL